MRVHATSEQLELVRGSIAHLANGEAVGDEPAMALVLRPLPDADRTTFNSSATPKAGERRIRAQAPGAGRPPAPADEDEGHDRAGEGDGPEPASAAGHGARGGSWRKASEGRDGGEGEAGRVPGPEERPEKRIEAANREAGPYPGPGMAQAQQVLVGEWMSFGRAARACTCSWRRRVQADRSRPQPAPRPPPPRRRRANGEQPDDGNGAKGEWVILPARSPSTSTPASPREQLTVLTEQAVQPGHVSPAPAAARVRAGPWDERDLPTGRRAPEALGPDFEDRSRPAPRCWNHWRQKAAPGRARGPRSRHRGMAGAVDKERIDEVTGYPAIELDTYLQRCAPGSWCMRTWPRSGPGERQPFSMERAT